MRKRNTAENVINRKKTMKSMMVYKTQKIEEIHLYLKMLLEASVVAEGPHYNGFVA